MSDTFKIIIPAQLEKSADGEWKVHGLASTNGIDKQGETIIQKGIDLSPVDEGLAFLTRFPIRSFSSRVLAINIASLSLRG